MKKYIKYILLLFCFFACENEEEDDFLIFNNSDQEILAIYTRFENELGCVKPTTDFEYKKFIRSYGIGKHSSKNFKGIKNILFHDPPYNYIYLYIYNRADVDNLSCEEFIELDPLKAKYIITLESAIEMNWMLAYP